MRKLSPELEKRLECHRQDQASPLPMSYFVSAYWPLIGDNERHALRCYSTVNQSVTMDGHFYSGRHMLLDFNEKTDAGFVMSSDHLIYGSSCGFRVLDEDDLAARIVVVTNQRGNFPTMFIDAWIHFSIDVEEIASLVYGNRVFGGIVTRIELQRDKRGSTITKVWGGYQGIVVSKTRMNTGSAASTFQYPSHGANGLPNCYSSNDLTPQYL